MNNLQQIAQLMEEAGPLIDGLEAAAQTAENRWDLRFDDGEVILPLGGEQTSMLTFVCRIGPLPEENQAAVHEALLRYNALWEQSAGVNMALDEGGELLQILHVFVELDVTLLTAAVEDLRAKTRAWREALPEIAGRAAAADEPEDGLGTAGVLRV